MLTQNSNRRGHLILGLIVSIVGCILILSVIPKLIMTGSSFIWNTLTIIGFILAIFGLVIINGIPMHKS